MTQDMAPFALVVRFTVRPEAEAEFDELIARAIAEIRKRSQARWCMRATA